MIDKDSIVKNHILTLLACDHPDWSSIKLSVDGKLEQEFETLRNEIEDNSWGRVESFFQDEEGKQREVIVFRNALNGEYIFEFFNGSQRTFFKLTEKSGIELYKILGSVCSYFPVKDLPECEKCGRKRIFELNCPFCLKDEQNIN